MIDRSRLYHCGRPISEIDIEELTKLIAVPLPSAYQNYMLQCNGGLPGQEGSFILLSGRDQEQITIGGMYELGSDDPNVSLVKAYRDNQVFHFVPLDTLPIAFDLGGSHFCLVLYGPLAGQIVFVDHEEFADVRGCRLTDAKPGSLPQGVFHAARSFSEFLNLLHPKDVCRL